MKRRVFITSAITAVGLAGCGPFGPQKKLRYQLKAYVKVDDNECTGSTVLETVWTDMGVLAGFDETGKWPGRTWGDAISIDLGSNRMLFGLLNSIGVAESSSGISPREPERVLKPALLGGRDFSIDDGGQVIDDLAKVRGEHEIQDPQCWPPFVGFSDIRKLETAELVNPRGFPTGKGGITIDRVTVSISKAPISRGIEKRLPWWGTHQFHNGPLSMAVSGPLYQLLDPHNFSANGETP